MLSLARRATTVTSMWTAALVGRWGEGSCPVIRQPPRPDPRSMVIDRRDEARTSNPGLTEALTGWSRHVPTPVDRTEPTGGRGRGRRR